MNRWKHALLALLAVIGITVTVAACTDIYRVPRAACYFSNSGDNYWDENSNRGRCWWRNSPPSIDEVSHCVAQLRHWNGGPASVDDKNLCGGSPDGTWRDSNLVLWYYEDHYVA